MLCYQLWCSPPGVSASIDDRKSKCGPIITLENKRQEMKLPRRSRDLYTIYRAEAVLRETDVTELGTS